MELRCVCDDDGKKQFFAIKVFSKFLFKYFTAGAFPIPTYHSPTALLFLLSWPKINFFTRTTVQDALE